MAVALAAAVLVIAPLSAGADHVTPIPDAKDCAEMAAPGGEFTDAAQPDRGAECKSDGVAANGPEFYVGGEGQSESAYADNPEHVAGDPCGAVVVGGQVASSTRPDDPATAANEQLDWDWVHTHDPDGVPNSGDEVAHHHTCD
jgi:hypothetical protein